jgi:SAM-dependent methyltransferase
MRAVLHFMKSCLHVDRKSKIYLTEQVTPLARAFEATYPYVVGSEYLRDGTLPGQRNTNGIRHEDGTALSFPSSSFDVICSFDVLEHVPCYRSAIAELFRCLKPGGKLLLTVPFWPDRTETLTRASLGQYGIGIVHHEPPEYHGDPLSESGALCFYHFGWNFINDLLENGFYDPKLNFYWSFEYGYLGGRQFLITATRPVNS